MSISSLLPTPFSIYLFHPDPKTKRLPNVGSLFVLSFCSCNASSGTQHKSHGHEEHKIHNHTVSFQKVKKLFDSISSFACWFS